MKKLIIIFFFTISFYAQNDIRGVKWGASIDQVIMSEKPISPSKVYEDQIRYDNIDIGNNVSAKIIYRFTSGKLSKVFYYIYSNSGNCKFMPSLTSRYFDNKFIFDILVSKGYDWNIRIGGWYFDGYVYPKIDKSVLSKYFRNNYELDMKLKPEFNHNNFEFETLENIDLIGKKISSTRVRIYMLNSRTDLTITFPTILNENDDFCSKKWMEEQKYFKTIIELEYEPNEDVKKQIFKSNF